MDKLTQATEYVKSGNKIKAKELLAEIIQAEPNNDLAWLWMSGVVDNTGQQRYCLEQALKINPNNQHARTGLSKLRDLEGQVPGGDKVDSRGKSSIEAAAKPVRQMNSTYRSQPLPDISEWSNQFTGWGIWPDPAEIRRSTTSNLPREINMGLLLAEAHVAAKRIFGWATLFFGLAIVIGILAIFVFDRSSSPIFILFAFLFLAAALYQTAIWYLNQDLVLRVFREGFVLSKENKTQIVFWRDVESVREQWHKAVYQGIVHINIHKIEIRKLNGENVQVDRTLEKIEEMGSLIQAAVTNQLLPSKIDQLKNGETCDFGSFKISRQGITDKGKKFLSWKEVKSLEVHSIGQTTIRIHQTHNSKWAAAWASENGGTVLNLQLFLVLANWFIGISRQGMTDETDVVSISLPGSMDGTEHYQLFITKQEAQSGSQKTLYIGPSRQERKLLIKIPAGVKSGTVFRFPDYGQPNPQGGMAGTLNVEVIVGKGVPLQARLEELQMAAGFILFILGMMWLSFWSTLDLITSAILAVLIGGLGGTLIAVRQRWPGMISGAIGGLISFIIQTVYYILMYALFRRESFWNYEMVILLLISLLPALGLYTWITKKRGKAEN